MMNDIQISPAIGDMKTLESPRAVLGFFMKLLAVSVSFIDKIASNLF